MGTPAASVNGRYVAMRGGKGRPSSASIRPARSGPETRTMPTAPRPLAVATATMGSW